MLIYACFMAFLPLDARVWTMPVIILVSLANAFVLFAGFLLKFTQEKQMQTKHDKKMELLTAFLTFTDLLLAIALSWLAMVALTKQEGSNFGFLSELPILASSLLDWRTLGFVHLVLQITCLLAIRRFSGGPRVPLPPENLKLLTPQWFTTVLRNCRAIGEDVEVVSFKKESMHGGCHYKVSHVALRYTGEEDTDEDDIEDDLDQEEPARTPEASNGHGGDGKGGAKTASKQHAAAAKRGAAERRQDLPRGMVVKVLSWDKPFFERLKLYLRKVLGLYNDKLAMYLRSYQIESRFYRDIVKDMKGFKLPQIYYNYEDVFNNQFGMGMEPIRVAEFESGDPNGFSQEDTVLCLRQLAKFHAAFWNHPHLASMDVWSLGGYWTGDKRKENKVKIKSDWERTMTNFSTHLDFSGSKADIGRRLDTHLRSILERFDKMPRSTLIHGDFKVTNLFVDPKKRKDEDEAVWVIDWQWLGRGSGAIDAVYFILTSTDLSALSRDSIQQLVRKAYYKTLIQRGVSNYSFDLFWEHFMLALVDFFVYVVVSKWAYMWPNDIITYSEKGKDGLHLRSFAHMQKMINIAEEFMNELNLS